MVAALARRTDINIDAAIGCVGAFVFHTSEETMLELLGSFDGLTQIVIFADAGALLNVSVG
jgi:hypothetical protein